MKSLVCILTAVSFVECVVKSVLRMLSILHSCLFVHDRLCDEIVVKVLTVCCCDMLRTNYSVYHFLFFFRLFSSGILYIFVSPHLFVIFLIFFFVVRGFFLLQTSKIFFCLSSFSTFCTPFSDYFLKILFVYSFSSSVLKTFLYPFL